jgi:hypothetical protein
VSSAKDGLGAVQLASPSIAPLGNHGSDITRSLWLGSGVFTLVSLFLPIKRRFVVRILGSGTIGRRDRTAKLRVGRALCRADFLEVFTRPLVRTFLIKGWRRVAYVTLRQLPLFGRHK